MSYHERLILARQILDAREEQTVETAYLRLLIGSAESELWEREVIFGSDRLAAPRRAITPTEVAFNRVTHDIIDRYRKESKE